MPENAWKSLRNWLQFWAQVWDRVLAPVLAPVLSNHTYRAQNGGQNWSQNWAQNCNRFRELFHLFFEHAANLCPRWGCPHFATFAFLARILACALRRPTTSSYLGGSLNGSHILRAFQAPKFGPPFTRNMLRATRRHAIDGEETQGPRAGEAKMKTGQNTSVKEGIRSTQNRPHPDFTASNLHIYV